MLIYLLRLLQHTSNKSNAVLIGSDMINTILLLRCVSVSVVQRLIQSLKFFCELCQVFFVCNERREGGIVT